MRLGGEIGCLANLLYFLFLRFSFFHVLLCCLGVWRRVASVVFQCRCRGVARSVAVSNVASEI